MFVRCQVHGCPLTRTSNLVLTIESVGEIQSVAIQMKAVEQYFPVELFIMLHKVVLSFESVGEILMCDH